jgi:hypothetical protein
MKSHPKSETHIAINASVPGTSPHEIICLEMRKTFMKNRFPNNTIIKNIVTESSKILVILTKLPLFSNGEIGNSKQLLIDLLTDEHILDSWGCGQSDFTDIKMVIEGENEYTHIADAKKTQRIRQQYNSRQRIKKHLTV